MRRTLLLASTAALLAAPGLIHPATAQPAPAQNPGPAVAAPSGAPSAAAQAMRVSTPEFIRRVQMSDRFEIASGRLAQQQAGAAAVKNFAAEMVRDHTKTTQELAELTQRLGSAVMGGGAGGASGQPAGASGAAADRSPAQPGAAARQAATQAGAQGGIQMEGMDPEHRQVMLRLGESRGADFDKAYMQAQVQAHQQAVDLFTAYAQTGDQAEIKQWAAKTLPVLQHHLQRAQQLQQGM